MRRELVGHDGGEAAGIDVDGVKPLVHRVIVAVAAGDYTQAQPRGQGLTHVITVAGGAAVIPQAAR